MVREVDYSVFLNGKDTIRTNYGFKPLWIPDFLFDFQKVLVDWAIRIGRGALFEDCGLGKSPQQLVWAENVVRKTKGNVLILAPLAVSSQTVKEGEKFGIQVRRTRQGEIHKGINITNYQRLSYYKPEDFAGVVCDESSILKNFDGKTRRHVTEFLQKMEYRLLCTATPAPNDFMELGTSSEALGGMTRNSMLGMFFVNDGENTQQWNLKGHAKKGFWTWVSSWARAVRKPSDIGFKDGKFELPPLKIESHVVESTTPSGRFFPSIAQTLEDQRKEKRKTIEERCQRVAKILPKDRPCIVWCQLNDESARLTELIPGAVEVKGSDSDDQKEERLGNFSNGKIRVLVTKPSIACFGLNWQHCSDVSYFPTHSHEQYYQAIRRCWRFGQLNPVTCHMVYTESEASVFSNMIRKERRSIELYDGITRWMNESIKKTKIETHSTKIEVPSWL